MKHLLPLVLALAVPLSTAAEPHKCTFQNGAVVETQFPCEPAMVEKFGKRLLEIYPEVRQINTSPDYIMGLYTFAMGACTVKFAKMTPEESERAANPSFQGNGAAIAKTAGK